MTILILYLDWGLSALPFLMVLCCWLDLVQNNYYSCSDGVILQMREEENFIRYFPNVSQTGGWRIFSNFS